MDENKNRESDKQIFPKSQLIPEIIEKSVHIDQNVKQPSLPIEVVDLRKSPIDVHEIHETGKK